MEPGLGEGLLPPELQTHRCSEGTPFCGQDAAPAGEDPLSATTPTPIPHPRTEDFEFSLSSWLFLWGLPGRLQVTDGEGRGE